MADKSFNSILRHTCSIFRRQYTGTSAIGEKEFSHTEIANSVRCLIQHHKDVTLLSERGQFEVNRLFGYFDFTTNIEQDDIVLFSGRQYAVVGIQDEAGNGHHLKVIMESLSQ